MSTIKTVGVLIGLVVLSLTGCKRSGPGASIGICGPTSYSGGKQAGLEQGSFASCVDLRASNVIFAVWVGEGGGGSIRVRNVPAHTSGTMLRDHECEALLGGVSVSFQTTDEKYGPVNIAGASHDLANGALFLAVNRGGKLEVRQMDIAKLKLGAPGEQKPDSLTPDFLRKLAGEDADIKAFWSGGQVESN